MPRPRMTYLQTIDDEEAKTIVENEQLILIPDQTNLTGFWHVSHDIKMKNQKYRVNRFSQYEFKCHIYFKSKIAAAIYISQHLGHSVCRSMKMNPKVKFSQTYGFQLVSAFRMLRLMDKCMEVTKMFADIRGDIRS
jgi:hypothetical protein